MNINNMNQDNEETMEKLEQVIQKKKEEIAGLQRLLHSIENSAIPEIDQHSDPNEKDNSLKKSKKRKTNDSQLFIQL